jgi:hypothetical protein
MRVARCRRQSGSASWYRGQFEVSMRPPDWRHGLIHAQAAPRCRACCRWSELPCRAPAMRGKRVCRLHGVKGGGPKGERNGAYRTGRYTAEAKAERRQVRMLIRGLRHLIDASEYAQQAPHFAARAVFRVLQGNRARPARGVTSKGRDALPESPGESPGHCYPLHWPTALSRPGPTCGVLLHAQATPRCRARCRRSKLPCRAEVPLADVRPYGALKYRAFSVGASVKHASRRVSPWTASLLRRMLNPASRWRRGCDYACRGLATESWARTIRASVP